MHPSRVAAAANLGCFGTRLGIAFHVGMSRGAPGSTYTPVWGYDWSDLRFHQATRLLFAWLCVVAEVYCLVPRRAPTKCVRYWWGQFMPPMVYRLQLEVNSLRWNTFVHREEYKG